MPTPNPNDEELRSIQANMAKKLSEVISLGNEIGIHGLVNAGRARELVAAVALGLVLTRQRESFDAFDRDGHPVELKLRTEGTPRWQLATLRVGDKKAIDSLFKRFAATKGGFIFATLDDSLTLVSAVHVSARDVLAESRRQLAKSRSSSVSITFSIGDRFVAEKKTNQYGFPIVEGKHAI